MSAAAARSAMLAIGLWLAAVPAARAADACARQCDGDPGCLRRQVECLLRADRAREAVELLKPLARANPDQPVLGRILAWAYHASGNTFWAIRTLQGLVERDPGDCASRAWLAWVQLQQGDLDLARQALAAEACPAEAAQQGRWALLLAAIARAAEDDEQAAAHFETATDAERLLPEDARVLRSWRPDYWPGWMEPVHLRAELGLGYTSNVSAGLPVTQAGADLGSPLLKLDLFGRWIWPLWRTVQPTAELTAKLNYLDDFRYGDAVDVRQANYFDGSVRAGLRIRLWGMQSFVGYRGDVFVLNSPDPINPATGEPYSWGESAPRVFYEGHRLDLELEPGGGVTLFAGVGERRFRRTSRTRWEVDGGGGWSARPWSRLHLLLALSLRYYGADSALYDQLGGTLLAVARLRLPARLVVRLGLSAGLDWYPNAPLATASDPDAGGRDLLLKPKLTLWGPSWAGFRLGLGYEYAWRDSTAQVSFGYSEHRALLKLRWVFDVNPWGPQVVERPARAPLPWGGAAGGGGLDEERIQDLLRQDEAARRGSSCVN